MTPPAKIVLAPGGLCCEELARPLPLAWGVDGSALLHGLGPLPSGWLVAGLDQMFVADPALTAVTLPYRQWRDEPQAMALFERIGSDVVPRAEFWQLPIWLPGARPPPAEGLVFHAEHELCLPRRAARPDGTVYRRYDPRVRHTLAFRLADPERDGERFTRWMNDPRVAYFWEQAGPRAVQESYLRRQLDDGHLYPLVGSFDDEPFGYFEVYWAPEDRIGRHYRWWPHDRGLHVLVGEARWRGAHLVRSWLRGLSHYLWLDEPRTGRLVMEPRADNQRLFRHLPAAGFRTVKEFDFPHRRSRLVMSERSAFFAGEGL
ncbi:GNAT family N-acetyltransferase [Micromonospora sp. HUAS LYJ1]|uniref:GNAT family N-acetyltransferase n=1 Tax=Micromonospora sp. HUAS LYJ1 TaxID=3061626 RepID=UPI00267210BD|nr:GNAT family N-acetyltransferase [Micromonospora sp. HUAS LYJ1]WKU07146.1 GNAT family N-acetyltransferase [Micromonospora sp. HUAS LYJ1]